MRPEAGDFARTAARRLRHTPSEAEAALWRVLRAGRAGDLRFRRQVPIDRYIVDFACLRERLVVEVDGSQHVEQAAYDAERTRRLEALGFHVARFWANDVVRNPRQVVDAIWTVVLDRRAKRQKTAFPRRGKVPEGRKGDGAIPAASCLLRHPPSGASRHLPPPGEGN